MEFGLIAVSLVASMAIGAACWGIGLARGRQSALDMQEDQIAYLRAEVARARGETPAPTTPRLNGGAQLPAARS